MKKTFRGINGPYLIAYMVKIGRLELCLHKFLRSDEEPDCHDHSFHFLSLVLSGGYREYAQDGSYVVRWPGSIAVRSAEHRHRVILRRGRCWTAIAKWKIDREWGYWRGDDFIPWRQYTNERGLESLLDA